MPLIARSADTDSYETIPEDSYPARCYSVVDLGTQASPFGNKRQILIVWELPTHLQTFDAARGPEPSSVSRFFTLSLSEKANLRHVLESWRGKSFASEDLEHGFDVAKLLGVPCLLQILHKRTTSGDVKAVAGGVSKLPTGLDCPQQRNASRLFTFDESGQNELQALPQWQRDIIAQASEYAAWVRRCQGGGDDERLLDQQPFDSDFTDDIPL